MRIRVGVCVGMLVCMCGSAVALSVVNAYSPRNGERPKRKATEFVVLHTTEAPVTGSLNKLKARGEAHYLVDTGGRVYRIIHRSRIAMHSGRSMWNGRRNLDTRSIGIEVVGYHNRPITSAQYAALRELLVDLRRIYGVPDVRVLTHSMVAYGAPNRWQRRSHRGRKRCGMQFANRTVRAKLGLKKQPLYDPDVRAGRLADADPYLSRVLYGTAREQETAAVHYVGANTKVISKGRSAWDIARDKYASADTRYVFPDGRSFAGNEIRNWKKIPIGTRVELGSGQSGNGADHMKELGADGRTASEVAGDEHDLATTIYFLANGVVKSGKEMSSGDFVSLPEKTRMLVGYTDGGHITAKRSAFDICGTRWNIDSTYYLLPDGRILQGTGMKEKSIPARTRVFFRE